MIIMIMILQAQPAKPHSKPAHRHIHHAAEVISNPGPVVQRSKQVHVVDRSSSIDARLVLAVEIELIVFCLIINLCRPELLLCYYATMLLCYYATYIFSEQRQLL